MAKKVLYSIAILGVLFLGLIIFGISVMGDRYCKVELQNVGQENVNIKTVVSSDNGWNIVVDSVSIRPQEKFKLGNCINCTTLKQSDFDFDALVIIDKRESKLIHRKDLPDYLSTLQRVDCATFTLK